MRKKKVTPNPKTCCSVPFKNIVDVVLKEIQKALSKWRYLGYRQEFSLRFTFIDVVGRLFVHKNYFLKKYDSYSPGMLSFCSKSLEVLGYFFFFLKPGETLIRVPGT